MRGEMCGEKIEERNDKELKIAWVFLISRYLVENERNEGKERRTKQKKRRRGGGRKREDYLSCEKSTVYCYPPTCDHTS